MRRNLSFLLFLLSFYFFSVYPAPPVVPGAGIIERDIEKEYEPTPLEQEKTYPKVEIDIPKEKLEMPEGAKVTINSVTIQGNTCISQKELCQAIDGCIHRDLSINDIYHLCHLIEQKYEKKGYFLARAYPPPQTIEKGNLIIEVLEGKLGSVRVEGNKFYKSSFILRYFASLQNKPLQYDKFLKALLLLNDNTDFFASAIFEKGKEVGTADLILQVKDARPIHLYLNANDYGRWLTTKFRAGMRVDAGNFFTNGDTLSIAEVVGFPIDALYFTDVVYTAPLNAKGTYLELAYLFSKFTIQEMQNLHLKGRSDIGTLKVSQALIRKQSLSIDFFSSFDYKQIQNFTLGSRTSFDKLRVLSFGAFLDHFPQSKGRDILNVRLACGIPNFLGGLKAVDPQCSRLGAGGRFVKCNIDYDRIQPFFKSTYLFLHASGQLSPYKLTLPEVLYIGGSDTIRGFPLASAQGDNGYYMNLEFRFPLPFFQNCHFFKSKKTWKQAMQLVAFFDQGGVFLQSEKNTFECGSGFGIRINDICKLSFSLDVGFPLNHRDLSTDVFYYFKITGEPF